MASWGEKFDLQHRWVCCEDYALRINTIPRSQLPSYNPVDDTTVHWYYIFFHLHVSQRKTVQYCHQLLANYFSCWWYPSRHTPFATSRNDPPLNRWITSSSPCSNARWACTDYIPNSTHPVRATIFTVFRTLSNRKRSGTLEMFEPRVAARLLIRLWTQCVPIVSFIQHSCDVALDS